jgi:CTP synthase
VTIAVVGKYMKHRDAYKSVYEALDHAGIAHRARVGVLRIEAEEIGRTGRPRPWPGSTGCSSPAARHAGRRGKIEAIRYARTRGLPFFGICLGMQCAVVEFARGELAWRTPTAPSSTTRPRTRSST